MHCRTGCAMATLAYQACRNTGKVEASLPEGFQDQLNDVTRAVLLGQPARGDICRFIADFLDSQLDQRTKLETQDQRPPSASPSSQPTAAAFVDTAVTSADRYADV